MPIRIKGIQKTILQLGQFEKRLQTAARKVQFSIAKEMFKGIVTRSPVDKGFALASWRMNTGSVLSSTAPRGDYKLRSSRGQISRDAARSKALSYAKEQLNNVKLRDRLTTIYISNSAPYIGLLEGSEGGSPTSTQAPKGMVRVTRTAVIEKVKALGGMSL